MATEQELAAAHAAREKAEKEAAAAKAELEKLQAEQQTALREAGHQQNADFAEGLVKQGSLKPADKDLIVQVLDFAEYPNDTVLDFGEGKTLADAVKGFLQGLPRILPEGETATAARAAQNLPSRRRSRTTNARLPWPRKKTSLMKKRHAAQRNSRKDKP